MYDVTKSEQKMSNVECIEVSIGKMGQDVGDKDSASNKMLLLTRMLHNN